MVEARERSGVDVTILRLLSADRDAPPGGAVTYLAEVSEAIPTEPWHGELDDHPLRLPWARPGGPAADVDWAVAELAATGRELEGPPEQVRTWNLSSIWRLPVDGGYTWLKCVPPFFAHEGRVLEFLQAHAVPRVIAHDGGRILTEPIPGDDLYFAAESIRVEMVSLLVKLQAQMVDQVETLLGLGLPDWRGDGLVKGIVSVVERTRPKLSKDDVTVLNRFVDGLPARCQRNVPSASQPGIPL